MKNSLLFIGIFLLFCNLLAASQESRGSTDLHLTWANPVSMNSDMALSLLSTLRSTDPNQIIYLPKNSDTADLPNEIYMCPGQLVLAEAESSIWAVSRFSANSSYYPIDPKMCPNQLRKPPTSCVLPFPWNPALNSFEIQWSDDNLLAAMDNFDGFLNKYSSYYGDILTSGNKVNADYNPVLNGPPVYPNQQSEAALVCEGYAIISVDGQQQSSVRLIGSPAPSSVSTLPYFSDVGHQYVVQAYIDSKYCIGALHILPDNGDKTRDRKYSYLDDAGTTQMQSSPAYFKVNIIEPKTCNNITASISPSTINSPLPSTDYPATIIIVNNNQYLGMIAKDVRVVDSNLNGWSVRKAAVPNGFEPEVIMPKNSGELKIIATTPSPLINVSKVCFDVDLESDMPLCDGTICNATMRLCINILLQNIPPPNNSCSVATNLSAAGLPNTINAGEDIKLFTTCYLNSSPTPCDTLQWVATGFYDKITLARPQTPKATIPPIPYSNGPITTSIRSPLNDLPQPEAMLYTYNILPNDVTPSTGAGNILVFGNSTSGANVSCSLVESLNETIKITSSLDLVPILEATGNGKQFSVKFSVKNIGEEPTKKDFYDWINLQTASSMPRKELVSASIPPFGGTYSHSSVLFTCPHPGLFKVEMNVDSDSNIIESNEGNNYNYTFINCGGVLACPDIT